MASSSSSKKGLTTKSDAPVGSIVVERKPSASRLSELGVMSWPKWGGPVGEYALSYDSQETCYLLRGKVKACVKDSSEQVEFGAGDLVFFPKGTRCTWYITVPVRKHYSFEPS